jgi:hypothetical protein
MEMMGLAESRFREILRLLGLQWIILEVQFSRLRWEGISQATHIDG